MGRAGVGVSEAVATAASVTADPSEAERTVVSCSVLVVAADDAVTFAGGLNRGVVEAFVVGKVAAGAAGRFGRPPFSVVGRLYPLLNKRFCGRGQEAAAW